MIFSDPSLKSIDFTLIKWIKYKLKYVIACYNQYSFYFTNQLSSVRFIKIANPSN